MTLDEFLTQLTLLLDDPDDPCGDVARDYWLEHRHLFYTGCCGYGHWMPWPWYYCHACCGYTRADSLETVLR